MKQTTTWQIPYPESPDHTRLWEYWQAQAERVDACLTTLNAGQPWAHFLYNGSTPIAVGGVAEPAWTAGKASTGTAPWTIRAASPNYIDCKIPGTYVAVIRQYWEFSASRTNGYVRCTLSGDIAGGNQLGKTDYVLPQGGSQWLDQCFSFLYQWSLNYGFGMQRFNGTGGTGTVNNAQVSFYRVGP